jgi:hypothetical protein
MSFFVPVVALGVALLSAAIIAPQRSYLRRLGVDPFPLETGATVDPFCTDAQATRPGGMGMRTPPAPRPTGPGHGRQTAGS